MSKQDLTRQEEFKRATAGTLRAIAHANAEVQVAFQPGPGGVSGKRVRLPLPTRALPPTEMAKLRGAADAAAFASATIPNRCTTPACRSAAGSQGHDGARHLLARHTVLAWQP